MTADSDTDTDRLPQLTLVVPAHDEEAVLPLFYEEAERVAAELAARVRVAYLFVDDGSTDGTLRILKGLAQDNPRVRYLSFSRNFGKEAAIYAGLEHAGGDYVAVMDADLQDPPSLLPRMFEMVAGGSCDCVGTRRASRKGEPPVRSWFAHRFYALMSRLSDAQTVDGARDFQLMSRQVADAVVSLGEYNRFSKGIFGWVGFRREWIAYDNVERAAGESKWSFWALAAYAIEGIVAFSTRPLVWASVIGAALALLALVFTLVVVIRASLFGDPVAGWPSLASLILFIGGLQLFFLGVLGQYFAKTYLEVKRRPVYILKERG